MPVYVIADGHTPDPSKLDEYRRVNAGIVEKFGGRFLARGGDHEVLEGDWDPGRIVIIEFPDRASARGWYDSPEYAPLKQTRHEHSRTSMVVVDGVSAVSS